VTMNVSMSVGTSSNVLQVFISVFPLVDLHGLRLNCGNSTRQELYTGITAHSAGLCSDFALTELKATDYGCSGGICGVWGPGWLGWLG
jgi:hypothetical protein